MQQYIADPKLWISALALLVASWSAFNSWRSRKIASRALTIGESQEERRRPKLGIYLTNGYRRYLAKRQLFGFLVSVSNPTDIDNSIAQAELQLTYLLEGAINGICRIPHNPELAETIAGNVNEANVFLLPTRVDAHQTVAGWLLFALDDALIGGRTVDSHRIIMEDSHSVPAETEPILITDWTNDEQND